MATQRSSGGHFIAWLLLFVVTAGFALLLLIASAVLWLAVVLDSSILSTLILGGFFAVVATAIYFLCMRRSLVRVQEQVATIYEVARMAKSAYEWIADKFHWVGVLWSWFRAKPE